MDDCCRKGFQWNGTPVGRENTLGKHKAYITGDNRHRAILICHDGFGWTWNNTRLLADHYAQEVGATVYMPDFFDGFHPTEKDVKFVVNEDGKAQMELGKEFDWPAWLAKNGPDARLSDVIACARLLREQFPKVGAVGYCWGGGVGFKLASKRLDGLLDCVSVAHPSTPTPQELSEISVPFQLLAPEIDPSCGPEVQLQCNTEIPKRGVPYHYQYFPGRWHGFSTKSDETKQEEKDALELAKNAVVYWMKSYL